MFSQLIKVNSCKNLSRYVITRCVGEESRNVPKTNQLYPKVIIIAGATGVGKSDVGLKIAKVLNGEIVIADSVQIYKGLDIGSTKPSKEEMQMVPHHLVDSKLPTEHVSAADFVTMATQAILDINSRNKTAIVVGGSNMWVDW